MLSRFVSSFVYFLMVNDFVVMFNAIFKKNSINF